MSERDGGREWSGRRAEWGGRQRREGVAAQQSGTGGAAAYKIIQAIFCGVSQFLRDLKSGITAGGGLVGRRKRRRRLVERRVQPLMLGVPPPQRLGLGRSSGLLHDHGRGRRSRPLPRSDCPSALPNSQRVYGRRVCARRRVLACCLYATLAVVAQTCPLAITSRAHAPPNHGAGRS